MTWFWLCPSCGCVHDAQVNPPDDQRIASCGAYALPDGAQSGVPVRCEWSGSDWVFMGRDEDTA